MSRILSLALLGTLGAGCASPAASTPPIATALSTPDKAPASATNSSTPVPSLTPSLTAYPPPVGPGYLVGFNPLTGLPLRDPSTMALRPLLIAVTNFPPSARPQAGLSAASQVWETSIGQGMTRFLGVYNGDFLSDLESIQARGPLQDPAAFLIGPVRSGRIAFEDIKTLYPGAFLLTHSASFQVREQLTNRIGVPSDDPNNVNSAGLTSAELSAVELVGGRPEEYPSLGFDAAPPEGGESGPHLDLVYNLYNQVRWEFDPARGGYRRFQNTVDATDTLVPVRERLDGSAWQFENVLVLFAQHRFINPEGSILDIELLFVPKRFGVLFRDGRRYEVEWSSPSGHLQLRTPEGEILPLKPGRTFFEVVSFQSSWDGEASRVRFHSPIPPTPTRTPSRTPTNTPLPSPTDTPGP
ncbi:MAG: DUF3048 C-terminal domain-containing protein [Anaerolineales bacterium]